MDKFNIREISTEKDYKDYYLLYRDCFPSDPDWGSDEMTAWGKAQKYSHIFGLFDREVLIGYRHVWCVKDYSICNVPYAGMKTGYRGRGLYPWFSLETEKILVELGYKIITNEVENPEEMKDPEKRELSLRRIRMFKEKLGYSIVKNVQDLRYERNCPPVEGDEDMQSSQFEYLFGFKVLNPSKEIINIYENCISKKEYEELYWSIRYIERGTVDQSELMKLKPISNFINNLHSSKQSTFEYY